MSSTYRYAPEAFVVEYAEGMTPADLQDALNASPLSGYGIHGPVVYSATDGPDTFVRFAFGEQIDLSVYPGMFICFTPSTGIPIMLDADSLARDYTAVE